MALLQLTPPQHVHGMVMRDTQEPRQQAAAVGLIRTRLPPQLQKRLLNHFFGRRAVAQEAQRQRIHTAAVAVVDHFQGVRVPP